MTSPLSNVSFQALNWDKLKIDKAFGHRLGKCFKAKRRKIARTQDQFVDLASKGALPGLDGEHVYIGDKDVQRIEQGRLHELSFDLFSTLIRCLGESLETLINEAGYARDRQPAAHQLTTSLSQMDKHFSIPRKVAGRIMQLRTLPNPDPHRLRFLTWQTFGEGIDTLVDQIRNVGYHMEVDACFGINDAGLVVATFINYAALKRVQLGYLRCGIYKKTITIDLENSFFPRLTADPALMLCDFEVKHAPVLRVVIEELRRRYGNPTLYFAVFGAMTESPDLQIKGIDELVCAKHLAELDLQEVFIACTMHPPGIEPPLDLK